jgi:hypothetical protein
MSIIKKLDFIIFFYLTFFVHNLLVADNRIIIHLQHASVKDRDFVKKQYKKEIKKLEKIKNKIPSQIIKKLLKRNIQQNITPHLSGFLSLYGGYTDISNPSGLISFPLRHASKKAYVAITPSIKLVTIKEQTVSHKEFIFSNKNPVKIYLFEIKEDENEQSYWDVKETKIPENNRVSPLTIVILSNPKNFVISEGHFITNKNPQLVLPEIYTVGNLDKEKILLQNLEIKRYFEIIKTEEKKAGETTIQKLIKNI